MVSFFNLTSYNNCVNGCVGRVFVIGVFSCQLCFNIYII